MQGVDSGEGGVGEDVSTAAAAAAAAAAVAPFLLLFLPSRRISKTTQRLLRRR
jgi:hypothetical protein